MPPSPFTALGIDVGGTKIAAGFVTFPEAQVRERRQLPTRPERGGARVLDEVELLAAELLAMAESSGTRVAGIGVGICELVSPGGRILSAQCLDWRDQPVMDRLSKLAPVRLEADVRAAALAEAQFGAGRSFRSFLYLTIGTGIASCLVLEGRPYAGARGAAGTVASSPLGFYCEQCGHRQQRTLEELAAGPALVSRLNEIQPGKVENGFEVLAAAQAGQAEALTVVQSAGHASGVALGQLVNVMDPEAVVIGGGLGLAEGAYWNALVEATRRHIWSDVHRDLPLLRAATGLDAGLIGAAWSVTAAGA